MAKAPPARDLAAPGAGGLTRNGRASALVSPAAVTDEDERVADTSPPGARLALRIGVTGHRANRLDPDTLPRLRALIREVLEQVRGTAGEARALGAPAFAAGPPVLRLISPIAEGTDRIVAEEALALGYELQCPLPFARNEYEHDFITEESRAAYRALLGRATAVLELDGSRETASKVHDAYEAVGRMVLDQSDLLLAVWDGSEAQGRGGTRQVVHEAISRELPTVWIDSKDPHPVQVLVTDSDGSREEIPLSRLPEWLMTMLLPPAPIAHAAHGHPPKPDLRLAYFNERQPRWTLIGWVWNVFRGLMVNLRLSLPRLREPNFVAATRGTWACEWAVSPGLPAPVVAHIEGALARHYAWADGLAGYYANMYRSSFVVNYLLGALVIFLALVPITFGTPDTAAALEWVKFAGVLVTVSAILVVTYLGHRRRWHERSIDYRALAELFRQFRFLAPLGRVPRLSRMPAHATYGDPRSSWMAWHLRAVAREAGMLNACFSPAYLDAYARLLHDGLIVGVRGDVRSGHPGVLGQLDYHLANASRLERISHRLRTASLGFFIVTLLLTVVSPLIHLRGMLMLEVLLPAIGAAFAAIRSQGEMERLALRSQSLATQLGYLGRELDSLQDAPSSAALGQIAESGADAMIADVLDWRMVFQSRPLELPG